MRLQVKAVRDHPTEAVKAYVEKRLGKLDRRLYSETLVEVTLGRRRTRPSRTATGRRRSCTRRARTSSRGSPRPTYEAAVDRLVDKLERQLDRYKDKRIEKPRREARQRVEPPPVPVEEIEQELATEGDAADEAA